ncbi:hypothetical protein Tco_0361964, partial [Tanacetum coccineum]
MNQNLDLEQQHLNEYRLVLHVRILQKSKENGQKPDNHGHGNGIECARAEECYQ